MSKNSRKIAVGLSGGVDSSVAAALLKQMGNEVVGVTMEIFDGSLDVKESGRHACYGPNEAEDLKMAASVCQTLEIPFYVVDLKKEYKQVVLDYFTSEYLQGRTPNPCIVCNRKLKFGFLLDKARQMGLDFEMFATGHYARIEKEEDRYLLKRSVNGAKDQTYFLHALTQEQLARTVFPLGGHTKDKVREIAASLGLRTAVRPESQDFITGRDYSPLFDPKEIRPGEIVDEEGNRLGTHRGIIHYTVGQRKGLGIAAKKPLYVLRLDAPNNRIVVSGKENLFAAGLIATDLNMIAVETLDRTYDVQVKIRLNHAPVAAKVTPWEGNRARVEFKEPQRSVTPGQSAVFYMGDTVLGGGVIERAL